MKREALALILVLGLLGLFNVFGLVGCQFLSRPSDTAASKKELAVRIAPERRAMLEHYSYLELFAASELLNQVVTNPANFPSAEGEGNFGCRLVPASASRWLATLRPLIEEKQLKERDAYLESPAKYQRQAGFERCSPNCSCGALSSLVQSVKMKDFKSPQLRASHREYVRKLNVKASRLDPDDERSCLAKQVWFCTSDLRDFLDAMKGNAQASAP